MLTNTLNPAKSQQDPFESLNLVLLLHHARHSKCCLANSGLHVVLAMHIKSCSSGNGLAQASMCVMAWHLRLRPVLLETQLILHHCRTAHALSLDSDHR